MLSTFLIKKTDLVYPTGDKKKLPREVAKLQMQTANFYITGVALDADASIGIGKNAFIIFQCQLPIPDAGNQNGIQKNLFGKVCGIGKFFPQGRLRCGFLI